MKPWKGGFTFDLLGVQVLQVRLLVTTSIGLSTVAVPCSATCGSSTSYWSPAQGYAVEDALTIKDETSGIRMWHHILMPVASCLMVKASRAIDVREDTEHQGLKEIESYFTTLLRMPSAFSKI